MEFGFNGVWRPGTGPQFWRSGLSSDEFQAQDKAYFKQGLRLVRLQVDDGDHFALWRPGAGTQWAHAGLSIDEFTDIDKGYFKQGLRLVDFYVGDDDNWVGVWRPGTGAQWWRAGMSWQEFKDQDTTYLNQGFRIVTLIRDPSQDEGTSYAAVWRPGTGTQLFRPNLGVQEFHDLNQQYFNEGLRLKAMPLFGLCGLWVSGSGGEWVLLDLSGDEMHDQDLAYFAKGFRLADIKRGARLFSLAP
jgi:hypothetical protein